MNKLFGTDGIRGIANKDLTPEITFKIGRAGAYTLIKNSKESNSILIGEDTRISSYMLKSALISGICSAGVNVVDIGVVPTSAISYLINKHKMIGGIMISASHNPVEYNGIKFFDNFGYKLSNNIENEIEDNLNKEDTKERPIGKYIGNKITKKDLIKDYIEFLKSIIENNSLQNFKIAVDCANGATYKIAPEILKSLGSKLYILNNNPNGLNINEKCGSTNIDSLIECVKKNNCNIGIAYDGDGDRCIIVDENGCTLNGDQILSICGTYLKNKNKLKNNTIVCTVMTNLGMFIMGKEKGINIETTDVGDRNVLEKMIKGNYNLGGEQSGHIIFSDYNKTGDGILTSLQILKIIKNTNKSLSKLNKEMTLIPQVLVNVKVDNEKKYNYMNNNIIKKEIEYIQEKFSDEGRILIRPSGTEPLIRIMIEGKNKDEIKKEAKKIAYMFEKLL